MVSAWYRDEEFGDPRTEHHLNPPQYISLEEVKERTGFECYKIDPINYKDDKTLAQLRKERNYKYEQELTVSKSCLPNYDEEVARFYEDHTHAYEEIRLITEGRGFWDIKDAEQKWIRLQVETGDLIILPAGIYHRFTTDMNDYTKAMLYFVDEPVRRPIFKAQEAA